MGLEILKQSPSVAAREKKGTLVLLHGACFSAWVWKDNFMHFFSDAGYEVWAVSLRGHGDSSPGKSLRWTSVSDYVDDLMDVLSAIDGPVYVLGHSMGGFIIQHAMSKFSPSVKGVVMLCAAPPLGLWRLLGRLAIHFPWAFFISLLRMSWLPMVKHPVRLKGIMLRDDFPVEDLPRLSAQMQEESFLAFLEMVALKLPHIPAVTPPVMVIGAEKDYLVPVSEVKRTATVFGVEPILVPNASHCLMLESGWEMTAERIRTFLSAH